MGALERMKQAGASPRPTAEKPDSAQTAEQSKADRLAALREEKGRLEAGLDLDGAARVQEEISKPENDMGISFWQRAWNTVKGSAKSSAAGMTDASRALYESGQNARTARDTETMAEYNRSLERAKYDMSVMLEENAKAPGTWTDRDIQSQQNIIDGWQRKYDAMAKVSGEQVQQKATQATEQLADTVQESAQKDIETAKKGLGTAGRLLVDAGVAGTQMLVDAVAKRIMPGGSLLSMAYRGFGSGAQQARLNGATLAQQLGYGAASAGVEVLSEKLFDGLAGIYGGSTADDIVEGVIRKMAGSKNGRLALHVLARGANEAAENVISGAISPALESIYDGKSPLSHYSMETVTNILHDAAVGGILGGLGGAISGVNGKYKLGDTAQTTQKSLPDAARTRTAQQAGVDTAQLETPASGAVGAAAIEFETPGSVSRGQTANLDSGAAAYASRKDETAAWANAPDDIPSAEPDLRSLYEKAIVEAGTSEDPAPAAALYEALMLVRGLNWEAADWELALKYWLALQKASQDGAGTTTPSHTDHLSD